MKDQIKEKIMKGFLPLVLCVCFVGFSETSKANEQRYRRACAGGDPSGCVSLGNLQDRRGDLDEAVVAFRSSCAGGDPSGCVSLGNLEYERGDLDKAAVAYEKSCDLGSNFGCYWLGHLEYERGNLDEAGIAYEKSCDLGDLFGCIDFEGLEERRGKFEAFFKEVCAKQKVECYIQTTSNPNKE